MFLTRNICFTCAYAVAWLAISCLAVCAQDLPAWQPYREVVRPAAKSTEVPAQYLETQYLEPAAIPSQVVTDVISDFDLNALQTNCCDDPFSHGYLPSEQLVEVPTFDPVLVSRVGSNSWQMELLPSGVIWQSYLAGTKEPRISGTIFQETGDDLSLFDITLGGRTSLWRYGYQQAGRPQGWELQLEGAGMLRLNLDRNWDLEAVDFRFGVPLIYAEGNRQWKFAYYHLSSHLGDEFLVRNPTFMRLNFSRDTLVAAYSIFPRPAWRWYAEAGWAFYANEGTEPWEFQFGFDFAQPGPTGSRGTPFVAVNGHLREEVNFGGNLVAQAGWLWRGRSGRVVRTGLHYFNGKSNQFEFFNQFEQQIGWGLWQEY